jgi:response regulator NasT
MRVWLLDQKDGSGLEAHLRQLAERAGAGVRLVGTSPFQPDFAATLRKLVPDLLDVLVINEHAFPEGPWTEEVLGLGLGVVVVTTPEQADRFRPLATQYPLIFAPPTVAADDLWLALLAAATGRLRDATWRSQVARLQQRLSDRIVIERAKGLLVQKLKITEEDAYKRLRLLSRRQRRQIRDIAQSLLDTQVLFSPEANGLGKFLEDTAGPQAEGQAPV